MKNPMKLLASAAVVLLAGSTAHAAVKVYVTSSYGVYYAPSTVSYAGCYGYYPRYSTYRYSYPYSYGYGYYSPSSSSRFRARSFGLRFGRGRHSAGRFGYRGYRRGRGRAFRY